MRWGSVRKTSAGQIASATRRLANLNDCWRENLSIESDPIDSNSFDPIDSLDNG